MAAVENGAYALLERRDVDNFTESVRTLNRTMTLIHETMQKQLTETRALNSLLRDERDARERSQKASEGPSPKAIPIATAKPQRRKAPRP
jgi:hypothetical protein